MSEIAMEVEIYMMNAIHKINTKFIFKLMEELLAF